MRSLLSKYVIIQPPVLPSSSLNIYTQLKEGIVMHCYQARAVRLSDEGKRADRRFLAEGAVGQGADRSLLILYLDYERSRSLFF